MRRGGFRHSTGKLTPWKGSRSVVHSRESGNTLTLTSGNLCSSLIALCSLSKRERSGFTLSTCATPAGGPLANPAEMKVNSTATLEDSGAAERLRNNYAVRNSKHFDRLANGSLDDNERPQLRETIRTRFCSSFPPRIADRRSAL